MNIFPENIFPKKIRFIFFFSFLVQFFGFAQDSKPVPDLLKELKECRSDTCRLRVRYYIGQSGPVFRISYWDSLIRDAEKLHQNRFFSGSISNKAFIYMNLGKPDSSLFFFKSALLLQKKFGFDDDAAGTLGNMGSVNESLGQIETAIDLYQQSLKLNERINDSSGIARSLNNLALAYNSIGLTDKVLESFTKCVAIWEKLGDSAGVAVALGNNAMIYCARGNYELALKMHNRELNIEIARNDMRAQAHTLSNIGAVYELMKEYDIAIEYYKRSLVLAKKSKNLKRETVTYCNLGKVLWRSKQNALSEKYADSAFAIANELGFPENIKLAADLKFKLYSDKKDFANALKMYQLFIQMRDSVANEQTKKTGLKKQLKFEYEQKENESRLREENEKKITEAKFKQEQTLRYSLYAGLALLFVFGGFMFRRFRIEKKQKKLIEEKGKETEEQKIIIEEKQKEILDSINYAKRIQYTLLAHDDLLKKHLPEHFVLFKPKDIVSGDFYWATSVRNQGSEYFFLAVCDSTGHGVPGAFMSLLNISFLNEAITEKNISDPGKVLDHVRQRLIENISQDGGRDGMDGILLRLSSLQNKQVEAVYAAANNAPVHINIQKEIIHLPCDKMPVGAGERKNNFTQQLINCENGDSLFLYTDGFADQFGGPKGKKFKYKKLNELLLTIAPDKCKEQQEVLDLIFTEWKGSLEQVDDVLLIGINLESRIQRNF